VTRGGGELFVVPPGQVGTDPEYAGHRDVEAEAEGAFAAVMGADGIGHPGAHQVRGETGAEALLDPEPIQRSGVVTGPERVNPRGHAEVDAGTTAGTSLDVHVRVLGTKPVEDRVQVGDDATVEVAPLIAGVEPRPVGVPLQIPDPVRRQQPVEGGPDEVGDVVAAEIEQKLVADQDGLTAGGSQDPLGMLRGETGLRADRLGFDPQPEVEPEVVQLGDESVEAVRELGRIDVPVAQAAGVVGPADEPAVVDHERLDTDTGCPARQLELMVRAEVELGREPRVVQHLRCQAARERPLVVVEDPRQPVGALGAA